MSKGPKLIIRVITFLQWPNPFDNNASTLQADRQTDGQKNLR